MNGVVSYANSAVAHPDPGRLVTGRHCFRHRFGTRRVPTTLTDAPIVLCDGCGVAMADTDVFYMEPLELCGPCLDALVLRRIADADEMRQ